MNKEDCLSKVYMSKIYIKATMFEQINVCANFGLNLFLPSPQETNVSNVTKQFEIQLSTLKVILNVGLDQMFEINQSNVCIYN